MQVLDCPGRHLYKNCEISIALLFTPQFKSDLEPPAPTVPRNDHNDSLWSLQADSSFIPTFSPAPAARASWHVERPHEGWWPVQEV